MGDHFYSPGHFRCTCLVWSSYWKRNIGKLECIYRRVLRKVKKCVLLCAQNDEGSGIFNLNKMIFMETQYVSIMYLEEASCGNRSELALCILVSQTTTAPPGTCHLHTLLCTGLGARPAGPLVGFVMVCDSINVSPVNI